MSTISDLQLARAEYQPKLPPLFAQFGPAAHPVEGAPAEPEGDRAAIAKLFPNASALPALGFEPDPERQFPALAAGVVLSGGQAPGGHNVITGLHDALQAMNPGSTLYGFRGGPSGLLGNKHLLLDRATVDRFRNTGGFDMIQSGRTKLETEEQFAAVAATCKGLGVTALAIVGGDDSNTNACMLAEYFIRTKAGITVVGVPKTIDGDLKGRQVECSFGFDTATKVYTELLGNIERDCDSARKYWHFIKVMGRSASHIALECALQCHPNITIISEEVAAGGMTLKQIVEQIAGTVRDRAAAKMNFGVAVVPEGLIEFIPEFKRLLAELNDILAQHQDYFKTLLTTNDKFQYISGRLSQESSQVFNSLPSATRWQLIMDRDPHGNVQVSLIETEKLLIDMVGEQLAEWKAEGSYAGKFAAQSHFFGYEGRCAAPSNFDADYCYSLGYTAAALMAAGRTGYLAWVRNLAQPAEKWEAGGIPLASMMTIERRHGREAAVIKKALVDLDGRPFLELAANRERWARENDYRYPGPIQYFGPTEVCNRATMTLELERSGARREPRVPAELLRQIKLLADLPATALESLATIVNKLPVQPDQIVIRQGDLGQCFYLVLDGELTVLGKDDKTPMATLRTGDTFGEIALLKEAIRTATVVSRKAGTLLFVNYLDFTEFLNDQPELKQQLEKLGAQRMKELEEK